MGFNRYILNIIIRSVLLAGTALLIVLFAVKLSWIFTFIFFCLLFVLQVVFLIRYVGKVNRDLANFLIHIKEQNTSLNLSDNNIDKLFGGLTRELEKINEEFKKVENEKIKKQNLLNLLLERVGTGILVINSYKEIKLYNKAILNLLGIETDFKSELKTKITDLLKECPELIVGEQQIVHIHVNNITRRILISLSEIKEDQEIFSVYSFHDIDREITDHELQSWNGLIKVLSHEIMNTITPMSTAVDTLNDCMTINGKEKTVNQLDEKDIKDTIKGINILNNRINGLQNFIKKFRQFMDIPVPELKEISVRDLIGPISETYKKEDISFDIKLIPETISIFADKDLIELVFINLFKNAVEANASEIKITAYNQTHQTIIEIQDNGTGIETNLLKKVFLPFYTTKQNGSGIGLSLTRQIIYAHGGKIEIESTQIGTLIKFYLKSDMT